MFDFEEIANKNEQTRIHLNKGVDMNTLTREQRIPCLLKAMEQRKEYQELEKPYKIKGLRYKNQWLIGKTTDSILIIDIDNHDENSLKNIRKALTELFPSERFITFKTFHGYQIFSTDKSKADFEYKNLKVLNVDLKREYEDIQKYKKELLEYLNNFRKSDIPLKGNFDNYFEKTMLCRNAIGSMDYLFNILGIEKGFYTIRLTRKGNNDKGWKRIE